MDILKQILPRYILRKFWKNFGVIFIIFTLIYFLADLLSNINLIFKYNANFLYYILYSFLKVPIGLKYIIPISILTASMHLFSQLNKNFELVSYRVLKVKKKFIIIPLIFSGLFLSIVTFFVNEYLLPKSNYFAKYLKNIKIENKTNFAVTKSDNIWYYKKNYIIRIKFLYFQGGIMNDISIFKFDNNFNLIERIDADYGYKKNKKWILVNPIIIKFNNGNIIKFNQKATNFMPIKLDESDFFVIEQKPEELNLFSLIKLVKFLNRNHINADNYLISIFDKIFYPLISVIFILLGFLLNVRPVKTGTILSIILAITLGVGYFILNGFFISLSKIKILPIYLGPELTFFIYIGILIFLNKKFKY